MEIKKKYRVDFYDMFDGWIYREYKESENDFESLDEAKAVRDNKNKALSISNKKCGEHFGVINLETRMEISCPTKEKDWIKEK